MSKVRVHQLAKELGIEPKDLIARLDKLGVRGKRAQSSLEVEEVENIRSAFSVAQKPQVQVGEEKVTADRVVKGQDEILGEIQAREQVVERRVRANVIRRRTSLSEIVQQPPSAMEEPPRSPMEDVPPDLPPPGGPGPTVEAEEDLPGEQAIPAEPALPAATTQEAASDAVVEAKGSPVGVEPTKGPRVLGRIDLKQANKVETKEVARRQPAVEPDSTPKVVEPQKERREVRKPVAPTVGATEEVGAQPKSTKSKRKVIQRQEGLEASGRAFRPGYLPKKKRALPGKDQKKTEITVPKASKRIVKISEAISVGELSRNMGVKAGDVIKKLMDLGMMATINQVIDSETASLVANDFDYQVENVALDVESVMEVEHEVKEPEISLRTRPPVVTMMGHVDHGKTSLLDAIRSAEVTGQEAGGITQHIGAYRTDVDGRSVTFLDTPGHEAFTAMRARGAKVTDIVVLVVAADDGVMPQTVEAINHARAAGNPIMVAINKVDKPDANVERVKRGLSEHGLVSEEWGGDTVMVSVSAQTKQGIPDLLSMLLLQADVLEFKANPDKLARGAVVEARLDRGKGPVATVLVQEGTLRVGDSVVCGVFYGKVRAMIDDRGQKTDEAPPSFPVEILGLQGVPRAGETFSVLSDENKARQIAEHQHGRQRDADLAKSSKVSLEEFYEQIKAGDIKELQVVLKADVQGSVEALTESLYRLGTDEVKPRVIHSSVGGVTESDILLASASNAIVIGFNVRPEAKASNLASQEGVDVRLYTVIYEVLADIKAALEGMLEPTFKEELQGRAQVRDIFHARGVGTVTGCYVSEGKIQRGNLIRLLRDQAVVYQGELASLRRFKDDVREVAVGYECGMSIQGYQDVKVGDLIEAYERIAVARHISPSSGREASQSSAATGR